MTKGMAVRRALLGSEHPRVRAAARRAGVHVLESHVVAALSAADGHPVAPDPDTTGIEHADPLDDPAPAVRVTAVVGGIHQQDGARWARVLSDPSPQVRKAAATHGYLTPAFVWTGLTNDPDPAVRKAVASSRWAPSAVQRRLLSDTNPGVAAAAEATDPLSRAVRVRPSLPADREITLPVSNTHDPRIRLLDCTAVTLTLDQQQQLSTAARAGIADRTAARGRVIEQFGTSRAARWVVHRWERWCSVFALPAPASSQIWWEKQLAAPFADVADADDRITRALALFDAVLGLAAAPHTLAASTDPDDTTSDGHGRAVEQDPADLALLTSPWEQVCLPTSVTPDTVYGPRTPAVRRLLTTAARLPRTRLDTLLTTRISIDHHTWTTARRAAVDLVTGSAEPIYATHFLFWDTVAVAEIAAWEHPTDPLLAEALWGAATVTLHAEYLSGATVEILARPAVAAELLQPS